MARHISAERKSAYYIGMGLMIAGGMLFASTIVTFVLRFGDFTDFEARAKSELIRSVSGITLLILGGLVRRIGARGLAGAGVVLDPERARRELEPYSRMAGGMVRDAMNEVGGGFPARSERVVMTKCSACGKLNESDSKFCQECGAKF